MKTIVLLTVLALVGVVTAFAEDTPTITTANAMARATKKVSPDYPLAARQLKIAGTSEVQITVSKNGDVVEAKAVKGNAMFSNSSVNAAKQWKFTPLVKDGNASEFQATLSFSFGQ